MNIHITDDAMIAIGLLALAFLPQIHLFLIIAIYGIVEDFGKIISKISKFINEFILPIVFLFCFYLALFKMITIAYHEFSAFI